MAGCEHVWVRDADFVACTKCLFVTHNTKLTRNWIKSRSEDIETLPPGTGVYQTLSEEK